MERGSVQLSNGVNNRKAKPGSRHILVKAIETLGHLGTLLGRDPRPVVLNYDRHCSRSGQKV